MAWRSQLFVGFGSRFLGFGFGRGFFGGWFGGGGFDGWLFGGGSFFGHGLGSNSFLAGAFGGLGLCRYSLGTAGLGDGVGQLALASGGGVFVQSVLLDRAVDFRIRGGQLGLDVGVAGSEGSLERGYVLLNSPLNLKVVAAAGDRLFGALDR